MRLFLLAGSGNRELADTVARCLASPPLPRETERFPDGELHVSLSASVRDADVYVIQPTSPPVDANLVELAMLADAAHRAGAARLTAVVPYFGYARQERRAHGREAVAAKVAAELVRVAGYHRMVALDLHSPALEGFFGIPLEHLSATPLLAEACRGGGEDTVVVAPDLGASKMAERFAALLGVPSAVVHKSRLGGAHVRVERVIGDVRDRKPILVDDMISTAGTVEAASHALLDAGCRAEITVVATHGLFVGPAHERLWGLPLRRVLVTDSVPQRELTRVPLETVSVAPLLADAILRLHAGESLSELERSEAPTAIVEVLH